jgi:hypothetical protein
MEPLHPTDGQIQTLLASLKVFCFPGGQDAARQVRGVKITQRGEMCLNPGARWMPFTAEQQIDATQSSFCWEARFGGRWFRPLVVTDAYQQAHGRLAVKLGGLIPIKKFVGPDVDKGEIQRYLSEILMCPSILLNHPSLEFTAPGNHTLRVRDLKDPMGATVDFEIDAEGHPVACRAERPRLVGKDAIPTPWSGICTEFQDSEGLRVARRVEARWHLPEATFTYFRCEVTSFKIWR